MTPKLKELMDKCKENNKRLYKTVGQLPTYNITVYNNAEIGIGFPSHNSKGMVK
jgi:hypothetical protein